MDLVVFRGSCDGLRFRNAEDGVLTAERLVSAFEGEIAPVPLRLRFRLGLVLVAVATLLLPLTYLAVVVATAALVYLHLVHDTWVLEGRGISVVRYLLYLGPAVVGVVL